MKIAVIGGTGLVGTKLVKRLRDLGQESVAASPTTGIDSFTGEGLAAALNGASVVVDVTNSHSREDAEVLRFFETSTSNLLDHEVAAGVRHHVVLSVVGVERMLASGFFRARLAQENMIKASPVPYSIIRATQFFESVKTIADLATEENTVRLPHVLFQPIAADDIATMLGGIASGSPVNGTLEIAGPERLRMDEAVRLQLSACHDLREVVSDPRGRYYGTPVSQKSLLPKEDAQLGPTRFAEWLKAACQPLLPSR